MSKYEPLTHHLTQRRQDEIPMQFAEIEQLLGFHLPPSSRKYRTWWSNNEDSSVITKAWLAAGYRTRDVDLAAEKLVFVKLNEAAPIHDHPLFGATKGTLTIAPGTDLTAPMWEMAANTGDPKPRRRHPLFGIFKDTLWIDPTLDLTEPAWQEGEAWLDEKAKKMAGETT